jgi:hypothetical protein
VPASVYRARLTCLFETYEPAKLPSVEKLLAKFAGREEELLTSLAGTYGPETGGPDVMDSPATLAPSAAGSSPDSVYRARLTRLFETYEPTKLPSVDKLLAKFAGREEQVFAALVAKWGPEPDAYPPQSGDVRS